MKNTPLSVRLTDDNRSWLEKIAKAEDRSLNKLINRALERDREYQTVRKAIFGDDKGRARK